jgi:hypothetical protein
MFEVRHVDDCCFERPPPSTMRVPWRRSMGRRKGRPLPTTSPVPSRAIRRPCRSAQTVLIALAALALLVPAAASDPSPVRAAASCTGWSSTTVPPNTIRVGRSNGTVETVAFRQYVGVVMAKEWPSWMPVAALEAGATAVKQYGWYYALTGRHRSSYVTADGKCFDVRDSTTDQLYKPEQVSVTSKIWRAVDATLGLSVRKAGKLFLTGYRAGTSGVCASDADGWRLFAKSVIACAEQGWTREQIQRAYYAPDVTFHWASAPPPPDDAAFTVAISAPSARFRTGRTLSERHARISWDDAQRRPAGAQYELQRLVDGAWRNVTLADPTLRTVDLALPWGETHRFRVRLRDAAGGTGAWYTGPSFDARLTEDMRSGFTWSTGDWRQVSTSSASGGTTTFATRDSSKANVSFTGRSVAIVSSKGPDRGRAKIYVDNVLANEIDLAETSSRWRVLVFSRTWAEAGLHTIRVEIVGAKRVDIDGILFYR